MAKVKITIESNYNIGDIVIFKVPADNALAVGTIEGYYSEDNCIWYNIRISPKYVFTYSNGGDIPEFNIVGIIPDELKSECQTAMRELTL